jgi:hypothetical protein
MIEQGKNKIHSCDMEPKNGFHYLLINGVQAARFDSLQKALAAREVFLHSYQIELQKQVQETIDRSGPYSNPID